ncbi:MAG: hypothetical protein HKN82_12910 [Akkermansiaceae bacterium]|nr:hypothetical protein [Akkermansiaceae bacterium]
MINHLLRIAPANPLTRRREFHHPAAPRLAIMTGTVMPLLAIRPSAMPTKRLKPSLQPTSALKFINPALAIISGHQRCRQNG